MKKFIAAGITAALATGVLAGSSFGAGTKTVQIKDNRFSPTTITVRKGTQVKWVWKGEAPHNVKAISGPAKFSSSTKTTGTFSRKLAKAGTYKIICSVHAPDMKMTIKVK